MGKAAFAGALVILFLPGGAAAPWLQEGFDAARTGVTTDAGPKTDDVAFRVQLPGSASNLEPLLIHEGTVYVRTSDYGYEGLAESGVFAIDLDSAGVQRVIALDPLPRVGANPVPGPIASDDERLFVTRDRGVDAYDPRTGESLWSWDHPPLVRTHLLTFCTSLAVHEATLFLACTEAGSDAPTAGATAANITETTVFVAALDAATGTKRWLWVKGAGDQIAPAGTGAVAAPTSGELTIPWGLAIIGSNVYVVTMDVAGAGGPCQGTVWARGADDGTYRWRKNVSWTPEKTRAFAETLAEEPARIPQATNTLTLNCLGSPPATPTGDGNVVYLKMGKLLLFMNAEQGSEIWSKDIGAEDTAAGDYGSGFALGAGALYVTSLDNLYRFDPLKQAAVWRTPLHPESGEAWGTAGLILADGVVYGRAVIEEKRVLLDSWWHTNVFHAFDSRDGTDLWHRTVVSGLESPGKAFSMALGDGVLAVAGLDGSVTVIGRTAASIEPAPDASTRFPAPGERVVVDLSGTRAGALGPATEFRADWGDGTATEWQSSPMLSHTYEADGEKAARFSARNAAGQEASEVLVFHVGAPEPNIVSTAFAPQNQEKTFFTLGILITIAGAILGLGRARRRQRTLRKELGAVEEAYGRSRDRPEECELALEERKARARGLLIDGGIGEGHYSVLDHRIDELLRKVRLGALDDRFDFLPHGMVKALHEMLEDGRITKWERDAFDAVLRQDRLLTAAQKEKVRGLIDTWFARDTGRA